MAKAIGCPTGFVVPSKGCESGFPQAHDPSLSRLHEYQASPAGLIESHLASLVSTVAALTRLSADPVLRRVVAAELADLHAAHAEIGDLISGIGRTQGVAP